MERQQPGRRDMGREKFLERVWAWKAESGGTIVNQLKRLGASCDWSRERFTMDEGLSKAVLKVFVELYREGLIYKDKRLVNWDPKLLTAISDLEVQQVEVQGHLWHIALSARRQDVRSGRSTTFIIVATTRPETMLGDTAVAVHPENEKLQASDRQERDPAAGRPPHSDRRRRLRRSREGHRRGEDHAGARLQRLRGRQAAQPAADQRARRRRQARAQGQRGVPRRRAAPPALDETLTLHGLDRFKARKAIVERLEAAGLLDKIEPHTHMVPHGDRSNVVIEPFLTDQWYVNAKTLAQPAIAAVREGKTNFVPKNWEKTYFDWMENIQPWCISRQLWWGHQIPAWYGPDGKVFVAETEDEAVAEALAFYVQRHDDPGGRSGHGSAGAIARVCSPATRTCSTPGSPRRCGRSPRSAGRTRRRSLKRFYPTSALVTGFDIIFFWVARMMMMGLHFMEGGARSQDVYIHAPRPRREGRQDVEVEGQRRRSARHHRRLRRRRAALHAGALARAGPRHQALAAARRGQPQLRDQAVERRALRRVQRRGPRRRLRSAQCEGNAQPLDRARDRQGRARGHRGDRSTTGSTTRRMRPTASSGTSIATGTSSCRSRC